MLLKVGELAERTGLTVRALHHYDSIELSSTQEVQLMSTLPTNIVRHGEPSRSALAVAPLRAVHQLLD